MMEKERKGIKKRMKELCNIMKYEEWLKKKIWDISKNIIKWEE
jgi:hypothetical protein